MRRAREFSLDPLSVGAARRFASDALDDAPADVLEAIELMVSELATNSIRHAKTGFRLAIITDKDRIRVEVSDPAGGTPSVRSPGPDEPTGRGLRIVAMLADEWGVDYQPSAGKTVWLSVARVPPRALSEHA